MIFDPDSWQEIWSTIRKNRLRTALTALGVYWGVFMLVVMVGAGRGLENGVNRSMSGFATNSVFLWSQRTSLPYAGLQPGRNPRFTIDDIEPIRRLPAVEYLAPRVQLGSFRDRNTVRRGTRAGSFQVTGDFPEIRRIQTLALVRGRQLNDLDQAEGRKVAVIGERVFELLFDPDEDPLGSSIEIRGVYFQVIGLVRSRQKGDHGQRESSMIQVPFATFARAFNTGGRVGWFTFTVRPGADAEQAERAVKEILWRRHKISPDDKQAIGSFNVQEESDKVAALFFGIRALIWFVGVATLLAGVVGVSNIMLISVKERTREIGVRKAVGATPARIVGQILQEAVALTSLSGYVGLVAGVALLEAVRLVLEAPGREAPAMFANPGIDLAVATVAAGVLVVAGALAGIIPARSASRVDPAVALRAG
jgi:putative ABC transport system permease protein